MEELNEGFHYPENDDGWWKQQDEDAEWLETFGENDESENLERSQTAPSGCVENDRSRPIKGDDRR